MSIERYEGRRGTTWRIRWVDHRGLRVSATFSNRVDAEKALRLREVETGQIVAGLRAPPADTHTFDDLVAYWFEHRATKKRGGRDNRGTIAAHLTPLLADVDVRAIGSERIDAVRARMEAARFKSGGKDHGKPDPTGKAYSPRTIQKALALLGSLLRLAEELRWIDRAPRIRKPKVTSHDAKKAWLRTDVEIARFLRAARELDDEEDASRARGAIIKGPREERTHPPGFHALYATAVFTGMRLGELAALRWTDVDLLHGRILVSRSHEADTTKGGYARTVPIANDLAPVLREWKLRSPGLHVFPTTAGTQRGPNDRIFFETLRMVLARAGIARIDPDGRALSFHSLRHTWASHLAMSGLDLYTIMKMGGWKSYAMVQVYAHLLPEAFDGVRNRIRLPALPVMGTVAELHPPLDPTAPTPADEGPRLDTGIQS